MESDAPARLWDLPYEDRVGVLRSEIVRVTDLLADLDADLLDQPAIGDWRVRDVVAHLVVVAEFYTDNIARGAAGDSGPSADWPPAGTGRGSTSADSILRKSIDVAGTYDAAVVDRLRSSALGLADALDGDEFSLEYECYHPGGIIPANRFAVLFLKELGLHEWDIFEALDPPCHMSRWGVDATLQAMEEELASGSLRWLTDPDADPGTLTFRVVMSGEIDGRLDLILEPGKTRLVDVDEQRNVDSTFSLASTDFALGCSGRRDLVAVVAEGHGEGDPDAVAVLARRLTGM